VADEQAGSHPAARAVWETAFRGLQRPEAPGFKRAFFESLGHLDLLDASSGTIRRRLAHESSGRRQGRVVARIARGLYYRDTGGILPCHHVVAWPVKFLEQNERDERRPLTDLAHRMWNTIKDEPPIEIGCRVLTYWWKPFDGEFVAWFFVFYDGMAFFALAIPRKDVPLPPDHAAFEFPPASPMTRSTAPLEDESV
jgi:hypothetical protein